ANIPRLGRILRQKNRHPPMRMLSFPSPTSLTSTSRRSREKATRPSRGGRTVNPRAKMSHVAAQKGPCCGTERLPDSLRLCYLTDEMAQTAGARSIKRGVPARARFFFSTEGGWRDQTPDRTPKFVPVARRVCVIPVEQDR